MFRDGTAANAAFVDLVITPSRGLTFQWRAEAGGPCSFETIPALVAPKWLKLTRSGNTFIAYYSTDGKTWVAFRKPQAVVMASAAQAGLAVTSHNIAKVNTAVFNNVSILGGVH